MLSVTLTDLSIDDSKLLFLMHAKIWREKVVALWFSLYVERKHANVGTLTQFFEHYEIRKRYNRS